MRSTSLPSDAFPPREVNAKPYQRSTLPANAPDVIARHTITIDSPDDVLSYVQSTREKQFHSLVQRYTHQLLYGCQNPHCATPTCFSYQKRNVKSPLRKFTPLSARALACSLASEKDPEAGLCHNTPLRKVEPLPPSATAGTARKNGSRNGSTVGERRRDSRARTRLRSSRSSEDGKPPGLSVTWKEVKDPTQQPYKLGNRARGGERCAQTKPLEDTTLVESARSSSLGQDAPRKDSRSFTQALFDTMALRMLSWIPSLRLSGDSSSEDVQGSRAYTDINHPVLPTWDTYFEVSSRRTSEPDKLERRRRSKERDGSEDQSASFQNLQPPQGRGSPDMYKRVDEAREPKNSTDHDRSIKKYDGKASKGSIQSFSGCHSKAAPLCSNYPPEPQDMEHNPIRRDSHDSSPVSDSKLFHPKSQYSPLTEMGENTKTDAVDEPDEVNGQNEKAFPQKLHSRPNFEVQTLSRLDRRILEELCVMVNKKRSNGTSRAKTKGVKTFEEKEIDDINLSMFIDQSVHFVLKDPACLRRSFLFSDSAWVNDVERPICNSPTSRESSEVLDIFHCSYKMHEVCSAERIWDSLWITLGHLFIPPPDLARSLKHGKKHGGRSKPANPASAEYRSKTTLPVSRQKFVPDAEAARICILILFALAVKAFDFHHHPESESAWNFLRWSRDIGWRSLPKQLQVTEDERNAYYKLMDTLGNTSGIRLIGRLASAISNRVAFSAIGKSKPKDPLMAGLRGTFKNSSVLRTIWADISTLPLRGFGSKYSVAQTTLAWANSLITDEWDGKVQIRRSSAMGGSLQLLASMYEARRDLGLEASDFYVRLFSERLDPMDIPPEWLGFSPDNKVFHLLSFPFLFLPSALVQYFRAINHACMWKAFENATAKSHLVRQLLREDIVPIHDERQLLLRLRPSMATFLVLNVRRDNVLTDAINLLWRRERRELLRPLKVKMGMEAGEVGIDAGGVQQEFFRVLFAEALNPDFGMFTIDERTRMTWYQPASREPLYKFEMLGLLMSLAVYNSITLSVTFPLAFYRKLLGLKVKKLEHIEDGWPDLDKGLQEMLTWSDGDVADVFVRTYEFSYEGYGSRVDVDMEKVGKESPWPRGKRSKGKDKAKSASFDFSSEIQGALKEEPTIGSRRPSAPLLTPPEMDGEPSNSNLPIPPTQPGISTPASHETTEPETTSNEASLVTNANREQFVKDYIFWLTDKSIRQQHEAFQRGFFVCLDRKAISIFTPEALKAVVEGWQKIDIDGLERVVRYSDGFSHDDQVIRWFWGVVRDMSPEQHRQLLEFVTASDRLPVQGVEGLVFVIQRSGEDDGRLPTSSTCFGRLLLPAYSSKEVLRDRLTWAIKDTRGFFMA